MESDSMNNSIDRIKDLLVKNGFSSDDESTLDEIAEEISESIVGLNDRRAIADTIYGNMVAMGISFRDNDNLMGVAENIAGSI
jgi:hypothetical protein